MSEASQYRYNASVCLRLARESTAPNRALYLEIAQHWMDLAREVEAAPPVSTSNVVSFKTRRSVSG
jgi:hypothetical protein